MDKLSKKSLQNIDEYYKGTLIIKHNLEPLDISEGINWGFKSEKNTRTYQVYLHSLSFIKDFLIAGKIKNKSKYFKEARKIILNWYNSEHKESQKWNEHAVASRIKNIITFQEAKHNYKLNTKIYNKIVSEHCKFLSDESNYKKNNHGLMMDISLIYSSSVLENEKIKNTYIEKALYRVRYAFYRDFSRKGVHLENSPEYHRLVISLYRQLNEALNRNNIEIDQELKSIIENSKRYNNYIVKPDYTYPLIGDTGIIREKNITKYYKDFVDFESGMAVLNNEDKYNISNSSYLTFKSGYQSKTHKHYDDLSITYYNFGHDILIDSGKYSYNLTDPIRQYIISPEAHNTILIKGKKYNLTDPLSEQHKLKITNFNKGKNYKILSGINNLYSGVSLQRKVILTDEEILFIIDGISATIKEKIQQNFVLNRDAVIEKVNDLKYKILINNNEYILETFIVRNKNIRSDIEEGYFSDKFSQLYNNERIVFEVNSKRTFFVTTLYKNNQIDIKCINLRNNLLSYTHNNKIDVIPL